MKYFVDIPSLYTLRTSMQKYVFYIFIEVTLNAQQLRPQEEYSCQAGQCVKIGVSIENHLQKPLTHLSLSVSFYQDHQNGVNDYRLETRVACTGANKYV